MWTKSNETMTFCVKCFSFVVFLVLFIINQSQATEGLVSSCIKAVADTYFKNGTLSIYYSQNSQKYSFEQAKLSSLKNEYIAKTISSLMGSQKWSLEVSSDRAKPKKPVDQEKNHPSEAVIIFLGNLKEFLNITRVISSRRILGPDTKVIVLFENIDISGIIGEILHYIWKILRVINADVFVINDQNLSCYTIDPFRSQSEAKIVNTWTDRFLRSEPFFPDKISPNLHKFSLTLAFVTPSPLESMEWSSVRSTKAIASSLNATLRILSLNDKELIRSPEPYSKDGYYSGFLRDLADQNVDLACGRGILQIKPYFDGCDPLPVFMQHSLLWVLKLPVSITGWKMLVVEFSWSVWTFILLAWFSASCAFYLYYRLRKIRRSYAQVAFGVYRMFFDNLPPSLQGFRELLGLVLLYLIVITTAYKSVLISVVATPPHEKPISTLDEAVAAEFTLFFGEGMPKIMNNKENESPAIAEAMKKGKIKYFNSEKVFDTLEIDSRAMALINTVDSPMSTMNILLITYGKRLFYTLPEVFLSHQESVYMSPAHPLLKIFTKKQYFITEAGLINHWEAELAHNFSLVLTRKPYDRPPKISHDGPGSISLTKMSGLFYVYLVSITISFLCFIFEVTYNYIFCRSH